MVTRAQQLADFKTSAGHKYSELFGAIFEERTSQPDHGSNLIVHHGFEKKVFVEAVQKLMLLACNVEVVGEQVQVFAKLGRRSKPAAVTRCQQLWVQQPC